MIQPHLTAGRIAAHVRAGFWSLGLEPDRLSAAATRHPHKTALVDRAGSLTYAELNATVDRVAAGLLAAGVQSGDVVALQLPNWREFVFFQFAAVRMGAVYLPIVPNLRAHEMRYLLAASGAVALVVPASFRGFDYGDMVVSLRDELPALRHVFVVGAPGAPGLHGLGDWLRQSWELRPGIKQRLSDVQRDANAVRALLFTSGTEANPKGVLHTANTIQYYCRTFAQNFHCSDSDVIFVPSPVGHATGSICCLELAVALGAKAVLQDIWDPDAALELIEGERCTVTWGATAFLHGLTYAASLAERDVGSFRLFASGGAPIPRSLVQDSLQNLGCKVAAAYGSTEGLNVTINQWNDPIGKVVNTDGRPNPGIDLKIAGADGCRLPPGETGEISYQGPNLFVGYLGQSGHTPSSLDAEGYFYSGDLGVLDSDGYLRVVGRKKDVIIRGGENISPSEVENLLFRHPAIEAVAIVGMPDDRLGERACAYVIPAPGQTLTLDDVVRYLEDARVARFKWPERLELVSELPMTAAGKVRKEVLRQDIAGKLARR